MILFFKIKTEKTSIKIGIIELSKRAFVAVVVCKAIYKKVLKKVIPKSAKTDKTKKFFFNITNIFFISMIKRTGINNRTTKNHLKNANSKGSIVKLTNLPKIKLPNLT